MTTILVVDDSPLDRKIAGSIVESQQMTAIYAENGQEALERLAADKPDVVLTDLQMPVMDGLQLVRQVKQQYPSTPVILITRVGSEEIAGEALRAGAASYVPKRNLKRDLGSVLEVVLSAIEAWRDVDQVRGILREAESYFVLGYEKGASKALIHHLQNSLAQASIGSDTDRLRVGTALAEALANAIDHGNLELDSRLRDDDLITYRRTGAERTHQDPYRDRRVHVWARMKPGEATFVVRDEGPGFDHRNLPDPADPENLTRASGRGVMLIRTFMDEVYYNETGNELTMIKRTVQP